MSELDNKYFASASKLLNVIPADQIENELARCHGGEGRRQYVTNHRKKLFTYCRPIYAELQRELHEKITHIWPKPGRVLHAPMAVASPDDATFNFYKFSVPAELLGLIAETDKGNPNAKYKEATLKVYVFDRCWKEILTINVGGYTMRR